LIVAQLVKSSKSVHYGVPDFGSTPLTEAPIQFKNKDFSASTLYIPILGIIIPIMGMNKIVSDSPILGIKPPKKGSIEYSSLGLAESLFSKVQLRVMALLFGQPDRDYLSADLIELADSGVGAVRRILKRLVKSGLVTETLVGKRKLYKANRKSPIYEELHSIILKTASLSIPICSALDPFGADISVAFIFGSIAKGNDNSDSDVDILIIGNDLNYAKLLTALQPVEKKISRCINAQILTADEWREINEKGNSFVLNIRSQPKIFLIGNENDL